MSGSSPYVHALPLIDDKLCQNLLGIAILAAGIPLDLVSFIHFNLSNKPQTKKKI